MDHREGGASRDFGGLAGSIERVLLKCHGVHREAGTDRRPLEAEHRGRCDARLTFMVTGFGAIVTSLPARIACPQHVRTALACTVASLEGHCTRDLNTCWGCLCLVVMFVNFNSLWVRLSEAPQGHTDTRFVPATSLRAGQAEKQHVLPARGE